MRNLKITNILSPDVQFKKFSITKEKIDLERIMIKFGKQFLKNQIKKNSGINLKLPHVKQKNH